MITRVAPATAINRRSRSSLATNGPPPCSARMPFITASVGWSAEQYGFQCGQRAVGNADRPHIVADPGHAGDRQCVIGDDVVVCDTERPEQQRSEQTGAILACGAVEHSG